MFNLFGKKDMPKIDPEERPDPPELEDILNDKKDPPDEWHWVCWIHFRNNEGSQYLEGHRYRSESKAIQAGNEFSDVTLWFTDNMYPEQKIIHSPAGSLAEVAVWRSDVKCVRTELVKYSPPFVPKYVGP